MQAAVGTDNAHAQIGNCTASSPTISCSWGETWPAGHFSSNSPFWTSAAWNFWPPTEDLCPSNYAKDAPRLLLSWLRQRAFLHLLRLVRVVRGTLSESHVGVVAKQDREEGDDEDRRQQQVERTPKTTPSSSPLCMNVDAS